MGASRDLARRIRASRALTPALRRYWLAVLPHLEPEDRERLDAILRRGVSDLPDAPDESRAPGVPRGPRPGRASGASDRGRGEYSEA